MFKSFLLFIAFVIASTAFGQLTQGTWLIGGNAMYNINNTKYGTNLNTKSRDLTIQPNIGYFVFDKFVTGLTTKGYFIKTKYEQLDGTTTENSQSRVGVGPFARYYFLDAESRVNVFGSAGALYYTYWNNSIALNSDEFNYAFGGGATIFFNTSVGLELLVEYNKSNSLSNDSDWSSSGVQFRLGLQFHLARNTK